MRHGSRLFNSHGRETRGTNGGTSPLPPGKTYRANPNGRGAILRRYRQAWRQIEKLKDPASLAAREALLDAVIEEPDPEYAALHLGHAATVVARECSVAWAVAMVDMLRRFDQRAQPEPEPEKAKDAPGPA